MGSCISKCCLSLSSPIHPNPPKDKLVISQSTTLPVSNPSSTSSISLDSCTSNYSSTSSSSHSSSSSSSSKTKLNSSESMSSTKENQHNIVILDPHKVNNPFPGPKQGLQTAASTRQLLTKRERSSSPPSFARPKSFKKEPKLLPASPPLRRASNSPSPTQRMKMVPPNNLVKDPSMIVNYRNERVSPPNSFNASRRLGKGHVLRRDQLVHREQSKNERMEDIDNPLISMECFIFL